VIAGPITYGGPIVPGGEQLLASPDLTPVGAWPDANVVAGNVRAETNYLVQSGNDQNINNFNQCMANAALSKGRPGYDGLIAACHAGYGL
jgi:hypothetical protein